MKTIPVLGVGADEVRGFRTGEPGRVWAYSAGGVQAAVPEETAESSEGDGSAEPAAATLAEALAEAAKHFGTHEFILAAPLSRLLFKVVRTSAEERETLDETAGELLDRDSPFPDEMLVTSAETVSETDSEIVSAVAAFPEAARGDISEALEASKVRVTRTDVLAFGWIRSFWPRIGTEGRKLVVLALDGGYDLLVVENGAVMAARGVGSPRSAAELGRETLLTALQAGSPADIAEVVVFAEKELPEEFAAKFATFGRLRVEKCEDPFGGVAGVAARAEEGATLDVTPEPWTDALTESRFMRKLVLWLAVAGTAWAVVMGVFFGVPMVFDMMTDSEKAASKAHERQYKEVKSMKERVTLVKRYSDHALGALEMLKAVSDRLPTGMTLSVFQYQTHEKLTISGESEEMKPVLEFKDALVATEVFTDVTLKGPTQGRAGQWKFSVDATFEEKEGK